MEVAKRGAKRAGEKGRSNKERNEGEKGRKVREREGFGQGHVNMFRNYWYNLPHVLISVIFTYLVALRDQNPVVTKPTCFSTRTFNKFYIQRAI